MVCSLNLFLCAFAPLHLCVKVHSATGKLTRNASVHGIRAGMIVGCNSTSKKVNP
jgi:hypothetical protein